MGFKSPLRALPQFRAGREAAMGLVPSATYIEKVVGYGPIAYWVLNETAGGTAADQVNSPAQDGTAVGITWANVIGPDGVNSAPLFDGAADYIDIFSAAFDAAFNGAEGTCIIWGRVFNAGVWADNTERFHWIFYDDGTNRYHLTKTNFPAGANNIRAYMQAGGGGGEIASGTLRPSTAWNHYAITWSDAANQAELFQNGVSGGTVALPNAWAGGGLSNSNTCIGAFSTLPGSVWYGWLAHCAVWDSVLSDASILDLATV